VIADGIKGDVGSKSDLYTGNDGSVLLFNDNPEYPAG
jgi:hypothetical protein